MVNLAFCRLDVSYPIISDNSEAQHSIYFHLHFPSAGRSFMLEFLLWSFKNHLFRCFPNASVLWVICCSDFVFQERSSFSLILSENQLHSRWSWIMIRFAGCLGITKDFFKQPQASVQIEATWSFELLRFFWSIRQILFTSVPLYYFDLKSDWLPLIPFASGSPPEELLFRYLLFVTIR